MNLIELYPNSIHLKQKKRIITNLFANPIEKNIHWRALEHSNSSNWFLLRGWAKVNKFMLASWFAVDSKDNNSNEMYLLKIFKMHPRWPIADGNTHTDKFSKFFTCTDHKLKILTKNSELLEVLTFFQYFLFKFF